MIVMPGVAVIMTAITVVMAVIAAVIMIVVTSVFAMSGVGSPFGFFDFGISIHYLYQLANGGGPLMV